MTKPSRPGSCLPAIGPRSTGVPARAVRTTPAASPHAAHLKLAAPSAVRSPKRVMLATAASPFTQPARRRDRARGQNAGYQPPPSGPWPQRRPAGRFRDSGLGGVVDEDREQAWDVLGGGNEACAEQRLIP